MKKIIKYIGLFIFIILGTYQTSLITTKIQENDSIMKQIQDNKNKFELKAVNAEVKDNEIIPGITGIEIDYKKSYSNMKKYGTYNESLTVLKETTPTISIENRFDKYITKGNSNNRNVSLIFKIENKDNLETLINILNKKEVQSTFFIDGKLLESNVNLIRNIKNHEIEILSYNGEIEEVLLKTSFSYLETITGNKTKYCYTEKEDVNLLKICAKEKMHTIKGTNIFDSDIYKNIKKNLYNSGIYTINKYTQEELSSTIDYIKSKGYNIVTLECLLSEKVC